MALKVGEASLARDFTLSAESFVWGLRSICQLHRIPFAPELVLQQFPPPYDLIALQHAARALGLHSGVRETGMHDLQRLSTPFVAVLRPAVAEVASPDGDVSVTAGKQNEYARLALVLKCTATDIAYAEHGVQVPLTSSLADFERHFSGKVLLWVQTTPELKGEEAALVEGGRFGFRWFIPELFKHRAIWRDVLLASLAIQLMALATPIFTQIVVDKVIVHHTVSTLTVIGIALGVFIVFTAALSWTRQRNRK